MSENTQVVEEHGHGTFDFGEFVIQALGGLVVGWLVFGAVSALVMFLRSAGPPTGWSLAATFDMLHLIPPNGVSLDGIGFTLYPPANETVDYWVNLALDYGAYLVGLAAGLWGYNKIGNLDGEK